MKKSFAFIFLVGLAISGCSGLAVWQKGHYYHSSLGDTSAVASIRSVGVYVFSDGESVEKGTYNLGLAPSDWPGEEVGPGAKFEPDTESSGPSLELGNALVKELNERGYNAKAMTDLGHFKQTTFEQCMESAKAAGLDAVFIAYYKGFTKWNESDAGKTTVTGKNSRVINITIHEGFLYLPHGGFYDTKNGNMLWKNSYYGIVENAHVINLSDEPFISVASSVVVDNGAADYIKAAPIAADILLAPKHFPQTTQAFPTIGEKRHRM